MVALEARVARDDDVVARIAAGAKCHTVAFCPELRDTIARVLRCAGRYELCSAVGVNFKTIFGLVALAFTTALAACAPPITVFHAASQQLLSHGARIAMEPVHFGVMRMERGWEEEWLANRTPDQIQSWQLDKLRFSVTFETEVVRGASDAVVFVASDVRAAPTLILRPIVTRMEPRSFVYFNDSRNVVDITVQLVTPAGDVVDEVALIAQPSASLYVPTITQAMEAAARQLGRRYARHLRERSGGVERIAQRASEESVVPNGLAAPHSSAQPSESPSGSPSPSPSPSSSPPETVLPVQAVSGAAVGGPLAPPTPVSRVARRSRHATMAAQFAWAFSGIGNIVALEETVIGGAFGLGGSGSTVATNVALSLIPQVGPFLVAATLPPNQQAFGVFDIAFGAIGVIGLGVAIVTELIHPAALVPLRPGVTYARLVPAPGGIGLVW